MSRVYEALRKAERQSSAGEPQPKTELAAAAEAARSSHATRRLSQPDSIAIGGFPPNPGFSTLQFAGPNSNPTFSQQSSNTRAFREDSLLPVGPHANRSNPRPLLVVGIPEYSTIAEQFHRLSLTLRSRAPDKTKCVLTIISALSGDGKSFVAVNLAASLALNGARVVLVDADLRQPALHHSFDMTPGKGLINYLSGEVEFGQCLRSTPIPGLLLVPAGGISSAPAQLLASPRMHEFIREGRSMDPPSYIIIDSPASSLVPESEILSRLGDASLVVVAANHTPRELVRQTVAVIGKKMIFGFVLNRFDPPYSAIAHYPDRYALGHSANMTARGRMLPRIPESKSRLNAIRSLIDRLKSALRSESEIQ